MDNEEQKKPKAFINQCTVYWFLQHLPHLTIWFRTP